MTHLKVLAVAVALVLCGIALLFAYEHGRTTANTEWQGRWDKQLKIQADDKAAAEVAARAEEQRRQMAINEVTTHAAQALEQARADAATASSANDRLRDQARKLAASAGKCPVNPGAATGSAPAANPGNLLAVVLDESVSRNRELAEIADTSRVRGLACEASYAALVKPK